MSILFTIFCAILSLAAILKGLAYFSNGEKIKEDSEAEDKKKKSLSYRFATISNILAIVAIIVLMMYLFTVPSTE